MKFVPEQIPLLKEISPNFIDFKTIMKTPNRIKDYLNKFNNNNEEYIETIANLIKNDESLSHI